MSERDELIAQGRAVLASRKPYAGPGAVGQTLGNESWRIVATGRDCEALSDALDLLERDGAEIARLRETITSLQTVMVAAAEELHEHWAAHCDADGYGPSNLMTRLERGIAAQYLYKAGDFARLHASLADLAADRDAARAALAEAQRDAERYRLMRRNPTVDGESLVVVEVLDFNEDGPTDVYYAYAGDPLDAAIDAVIAKEQSHASE